MNCVVERAYAVQARLGDTENFKNSKKRDDDVVTYVLVGRYYLTREDTEVLACQKIVRD